MNIGWLKILGATIGELVWVTGLKYASTPLEWLATLLAVTCSTYCLLTAMKTLPVGTAYSVFVGLSAVGTIAIEAIFFSVYPSTIQIIFIIVLISGVIGLRLLNEVKIN